eukprot:TRINITY_DN383_c0_g2_i1.p1 TRINITY_DN383_c0_g2~~TRINITY_DN383_c0_g2_i1.p1  ORF type:complete len:824 (+),score=210.42 TRINITY_DN383_c0_g2_i1:149-2620(+)
MKTIIVSSSEGQDGVEDLESISSELIRTGDDIIKFLKKTSNDVVAILVDLAEGGDAILELFNTFVFAMPIVSINNGKFSMSRSDQIKKGVTDIWMGPLDSNFLQYINRLDDLHEEQRNNAMAIRRPAYATLDTYEDNSIESLLRDIECTHISARLIDEIPSLVENEEFDLILCDIERFETEIICGCTNMSKKPCGAVVVCEVADVAKALRLMSEGALGMLLRSSPKEVIHTSLEDFRQAQRTSHFLDFTMDDLGGNSVSAGFTYESGANTPGIVTPGMGTPLGSLQVLNQITGPSKMGLTRGQSFCSVGTSNYSVGFDSDTNVSPSLEGRPVTPEYDYKSENKRLKKVIDELLWKHLRKHAFKSIPGIKSFQETEKRVGVYSLDQFLGEGSFGNVRVGTNVETQRRVAIKIMDKTLMSSMHDLQSTDTEIRTLRLLKHPNIVNLVDVLHSQANLYIIQEYIPGCDMSYFLEDHSPLSEKQIRMFFSQIVEALDYCHSRGIAHRDLKPENIMISDETIKILDFGLAYKVSPGQRMKQYVGSKGFVAPEVILGDYDPLCSDVWSIGCVLLEMICGLGILRTAGLVLGSNESLDLPDIQSKVEKLNDIPAFNSCAPALQDMVKRCLSVDERARVSVSRLSRHQFLFPEASTPMTPLATPGNRKSFRESRSRAGTSPAMQLEAELGSLHIPGDILSPGHGHGRTPTNTRSPATRQRKRFSLNPDDAALMRHRALKRQLSDKPDVSSLSPISVPSPRIVAQQRSTSSAAMLPPLNSLSPPVLKGNLKYVSTPSPFNPQRKSGSLTPTPPDSASSRRKFFTNQKSSRHL